MEVWSKIKTWFKTNNRLSIWLLTIFMGLVAHFELCANDLVMHGENLHFDLLTFAINSSFFSTLISLIIMGFVAIFLMDLLKIKKEFIKS